MNVIDRWKEFRASYSEAEFDPTGIVEWGDDAVSEIERLQAALRIVWNFPPHPGGTEWDQSEHCMDPADWRGGWIAAIDALHERVREALGERE